MNQVYKKAYTEILEIIKYLSRDEYEKIPKEKVEFYKNNKDSLYQFKYDPYKTLNEQKVLRETKVLIVNLFRDVVATETQKEKLNILLVRNEQEYQNKLQKEYSYDKLFNKKTKSIIAGNKKEEENVHSTNMIVYKENIFVKIYHIFKSIFNKKIKS